MVIKAVLIYANDAINITDSDGKSNDFWRTIPKTAIAIMGSSDKFDAGIFKFLKSFIDPDNWYDVKPIQESIVYNEPSPYSGTWTGITIIRCNTIQLSGSFKVIDYVAF